MSSAPSGGGTVGQRDYSALNQTMEWMEKVLAPFQDAVSRLREVNRRMMAVYRAHRASDVWSLETELTIGELDDEP